MSTSSGQTATEITSQTTDNVEEELLAIDSAVGLYLSSKEGYSKKISELLEGIRLSNICGNVCKGWHHQA